MCGPMILRAIRSSVVSKVGAARLPALAAASLLVATGCGASPDEPGSASDGVPAGFTKAELPKELLSTLPLVAPKSDLDTPLFSDIVDVQPGEDVTFCTFTKLILDKDTIFGESFGAESPQGHHAILQYTTTPQDPHTGPCGQMDGPIMLGGTGGKGASDKPTLPTNYGVLVPAGAQLVINHHWINTTEQPVKGQAEMLARRLPDGGNTVLAGNLPMLGLGWTIPAAGSLSYSTSCTYGADVSYVLALGHMHEFGQHVTIAVDRVGGGTDTLIDQAWTKDSGTTAGGKIFSLDDPYVVHQGDTVRLTCDWHNSTPNDISFPREMCIFFGYTIGSNYFCANGTWMSASQVPTAVMSNINNHL